MERNNNNRGLAFSADAMHGYPRARYGAPELSIQVTNPPNALKDLNDLATQQSPIQLVPNGNSNAAQAAALVGNALMGTDGLRQTFGSSVIGIQPITMINANLVHKPFYKPLQGSLLRNNVERAVALFPNDTFSRNAVISGGTATFEVKGTDADVLAAQSLGVPVLVLSIPGSLLNSAAAAKYNITVVTANEVKIPHTPAIYSVVRQSVTDGMYLFIIPWKQIAGVGMPGLAYVEQGNAASKIVVTITGGVEGERIDLDLPGPNHGPYLQFLKYYMIQAPISFDNV